MTRTLSSIKEINLSWLKETLLEVEEFQDDEITGLDVKQVGEGIGQLGEFAERIFSAIKDYDAMRFIA